MRSYLTNLAEVTVRLVLHAPNVYSGPVVGEVLEEDEDRDMRSLPHRILMGAMGLGDNAHCLYPPIDNEVSIS